MAGDQDGPETGFTETDDRIETPPPASDEETTVDDPVLATETPAPAPDDPAPVATPQQPDGQIDGSGHPNDAVDWSAVVATPTETPEVVSGALPTEELAAAATAAGNANSFTGPDTYRHQDEISAGEQRGDRFAGDSQDAQNLRQLNIDAIGDAADGVYGGVSGAVRGSDAYLYGRNGRGRSDALSNVILQEAALANIEANIAAITENIQETTQQAASQLQAFENRFGVDEQVSASVQRAIDSAQVAMATQNPEDIDQAQEDVAVAIDDLGQEIAQEQEIQQGLEESIRTEQNIGTIADSVAHADPENQMTRVPQSQVSPIDQLFSPEDAIEPQMSPVGLNQTMYFDPVTNSIYLEYKNPLEQEPVRQLSQEEGDALLDKLMESDIGQQSTDLGLIPIDTQLLSHSAVDTSQELMADLKHSQDREAQLREIQKSMESLAEKLNELEAEVSRKRDVEQELSGGPDFRPDPVQQAIDEHKNEIANAIAQSGGSITEDELRVLAERTGISETDGAFNQLSLALNNMSGINVIVDPTTGEMTEVMLANTEPLATSEPPPIIENFSTMPAEESRQGSMISGGFNVAANEAPMSTPEGPDLNNDLSPNEPDPGRSNLPAPGSVA